jgi:hypothetical protein
MVDRDEVSALLQALFVQQPCSNPSECPESLRKALCEGYAYLQAISQAPEICSKVSCRLCAAEVRGFEAPRLHSRNSCK